MGSPDIAGGVHVGKDEMDVGAGDQGIMFGYASDETEVCMPLTILMATRLGKKLTDVRKDGSLWWLRPDGKTQVTIEYKQNDDGSMEPLKIHTVVISTRHAEPGKALRSKECDGYKGPEMTAPTMEMMNKAIEKDVIVKCLEEIKLKNGQPAVTLYGDHTHLHINPSGKFIIGGPQGDAGLTGRKIIIDTYGTWGAHGGGAFSGKDPTKVDRSAAYICRQMAKSVVKSGLSKRALVQLSYAIGVAKPLSLFVETYGTEQGSLTPQAITNIVKIHFDCRPGAIAKSLQLREPKYQLTAAYGHFGRKPYTDNGMKYFEWENATDLSKYTAMTPAAVEAELKKSNYLQKWVDQAFLILAACTAGAASSVCHVSPGGRVRESERFFLRRRFLFFFFQFLNGCEEKWQDFLSTGDIDVSFCNNSHHFSMIYAATMFRELQAITSGSFLKTQTIS